MTNVLIADHHALSRKGIKDLLQTDSDFDIIGKAASAKKLYKILEKKTPDILLLDIDLPNLNGINCLRNLRSEYSNMSILIFSSQPEEIYAIRAVKSGAAGYISKSASVKHFHKAMKHVASGGVYLNKQIAPTLADKSSKSKISAKKSEFKTLSSRETEVLNLLSKGRRNKDIAETLDINEKTVSTYKTRLLKKLKAKSLADLINHARLGQTAGLKNAV